MDIRIIGCAISLLFATNNSYSSEIQKWVDQDGRVHFGDIAPANANTTELHPEIITTKPSYKSLKNLLRPGERLMLKNYEQRGRRLIKAKKTNARQEKRAKRELAKNEGKCGYHQQKKEALEAKLRRGYKPAQKSSIKGKIAREKLKINRYCS